jgi:hypothetical protein
VEDYRSLLSASGFSAVEVIDTGTDLNAYAKADNAACCVPQPAGEGALPIAEDGGCCGGPPAEAGVHEQLADLLRKYDINDYAASVRVFAVKPAKR